MVSTRVRARAAMAALDRRNLNLDDFVGLNWSYWIDKVNILASEESNVEECSKYGKILTETMTLRKEDMPIYGHCPAHDDFYLVVCSQCGQVVKPQAFEKHCERRHASLTKLCSQSSPSAPQQRPWPGCPPAVLPSAKERQRDGRHQDVLAPTTTTTTQGLPQHGPSVAHKEVGSLPPVEKSPQETPPSPPNSSTPRPRVPPWHSGPLAQGGPPSSSTSSPEKAPLQRPVPGKADEQQGPPRGQRTYSRTLKVHKKECDLDKHCGVLDPERKKLCTRQLMCNIHSIHQRRKVVGRSKTFDQLVLDHRAASRSLDLEPPPVCRDAHVSKDTLSHAEELTTPQHNKHIPGSNVAILRSKEPSEGSPQQDGDGSVEPELQPPYPFKPSLRFNGESDGEDPEDARDLPATTWHPKPLGLCTFGSRTLGCSIFTFDRRLHRLRFALSAMVEHHINTHLWRKIPQVSSGLRSHHATTSSSRSTVRTMGSASSSSGSSSSFRCPPSRSPSLSHRATVRESCSSGRGPSSSGQSNTKSSQYNPFSTKPPSSTLLSAGLRPDESRNSVDRPSKSRLRDLELRHTTGVTERASKPHHGDKDHSSKRIRERPLHEKGRLHSPERVYPAPTLSTQGPVNGTLPLGKKPSPAQPPHSPERHLSSSGPGKRSPFPMPLRPSHSVSRSRGRPPGLHRRPVGYDHRGLAKKRKTSGGGSPPHSPSLSRPPKAHCLSTLPHSHSSLLWRGQSMGGTLGRGLEKTADPHRPKLQHKGSLP